MRARIDLSPRHSPHVHLFEQGPEPVRMLVVDADRLFQCRCGTLAHDLCLSFLQKQKRPLIGSGFGIYRFCLRLNRNRSQCRLRGIDTYSSNRDSWGGSAKARRCGKNCQVGANPSSPPSIPIREGRAISETAARLGWSKVFSHTPCQASGHLIGAKGGYCPGVALPTGKERHGLDTRCQSWRPAEAVPGGIGAVS